MAVEYTWILLLVELLLAVASHQYLVMAQPHCDVMWLAGDCSAIEYTQGSGTGSLVNP